LSFIFQSTTSDTSLALGEDDRIIVALDKISTEEFFVTDKINTALNFYLFLQCQFIELTQYYIEKDI
jgi:hypothetical protein